MKLDIVIPKLLLPKVAMHGQTPLFIRSLLRLLSRGDHEFFDSGFTDWLGQQWKISSPSVAPVTACADGLANGNWLRADPVHLRVQRDNVQLLDTALLDVKADEAAALIATLNLHFATDGLIFHAPVANRWYVELPENQMPATQPIDKVIGNAVFDHQPVSPGKINWKAIANEIQMLLFEHPVNLAREAAGTLTINGVWFWGEGALPASISKPPWDSIYAKEPYLAGLSRLSGTTILQPPATANHLTVSHAGHLIYLDDLDQPARRNDFAEWNVALNRLEQDWFTPLHKLLQQRKCVCLNLILPVENGIVISRLTAQSLWKFWRSDKPLQWYFPV